MKLLGLNDRFFGFKVVKIDGKKRKITVVDSRKKHWSYSFSEVENNLDQIIRE